MTVYLTHKFYTYSFCQFYSPEVLVSTNADFLIISSEILVKDILSHANLICQDYFKILQSI